jgi:CubicO group peptidase (beta-lactamase class C family)
VRRVETGLLTYNVVRGEAPARHTIEERMRHYRVPGVSVAVVNDGKLEWAKGYGVREAGADGPVTAETLFQAASVSKPVAAVAALRLVQQGVLKLDEDVNLRLRSWKVPENEFTRAEKVTLRRLLSHSAGTTVFGFLGYGAGEPVPTLVQILNGEPPANNKPVRVNAAPGGGFRYSGGGLTVAQLLLVDVTGRAFPDLLRETVLAPVRMGRSTFAQPLPAELAREAATGHEADGAVLRGRYHTYPEMAAAGLWTTPSDLARFGIEIQRALAGDAERVLSPETARQMLTPQAKNYGLGVWVEGEGGDIWFTHSGANAGFQMVFVMSARGGRGAVVMTNGDAGYDLGAEVVRAVAREYGWSRYGPNERDAISPGAEVLAQLAGTYAEAGAGADKKSLRVSVEGGVLTATSNLWRWGGRELRANTPTSYFFLDGPGELNFERDLAGKVVAAVIYGSGDPLRLIRQ